uniref:Ig-like domain-containing protein n=1 Tax=Chelydra serpentina TaxID=8475 RepID=A0A8C3XNH3_CHESE
MGRSLVKSHWPCIAGKDLELVRKVQGGALTTVCHYNEHNYSQREKFWCKERSDLECHTLVLSSPAAGRNSLNPPNARVNLKDSGTGWISVSMAELQVEDSGIYWCGVSDDLKIIQLKKIKLAVSYEAPMTLSAKKGDSISLNCSYSMMDDSRRPNNFTWCKMVTATRCQPVVSVEIDKIVNTQGRTRIQTDMRYRVIIVTLVVLQLRDSGEYHCETHLQGSTVLLKMITLNVLGELLKENCPSLKKSANSHPLVDVVIGQSSDGLLRAGKLQETSEKFLNSPVQTEHSPWSRFINAALFFDIPPFLPFSLSDSAGSRNTEQAIGKATLVEGPT